MSNPRLSRLRDMRAWLDAEIAEVLADEVRELRNDPATQTVLDLYAVPVEAILLGVRSHDVTRARHALTWLLHRNGWSVRDLARVLPYAGQPSVCKALHRVENDGPMRTILAGLGVAHAS